MKKETYKGYLCQTEFDVDLAMGSPDVKIYTSLKALKRGRTCWKECGIVQVEITKVRRVFKGTGLK